MLKPYFHITRVEVGCDEAGRGSLSGPVITASVILPKDFNHELIKDSKKLSENKREEAFNIILDNCIDYSISFIDNNRIDEINILKSTMEGFHQCLDKMIVKFEHILVDGNIFYPYKDIPHTCVIKGDSEYTCIAAASILAKVSRDIYMKEIHKEYPVYNWDKNKGYYGGGHFEKIKEHGITNYHRKTFLKNL